MPNQDWYNLGDEIKNIVQDAIDSKNFNRLNQTINRTINDTMDNVGRTIQDAGYAAKNAGNAAKDAARSAARDIKQNVRNGAPYQSRPQQRRANSQSSVNPPVPQSTELGVFGKTSSTNAGGYALAITGGILAGGLGCAEFILGIIALATGRMGVLLLPILILFPFLAASIFMTWKGSKMLGRVKRFKHYLRGLHGRTYCEIKELAHLTGKTKGFVIRDLRNMIDCGLFLEGHLDQQGTCLIVTDETYQQYRTLQLQLEEKQRVEKLGKSKPEEPVSEEKLSPDVQSVIEEGNTYIRKLIESNNAIPGVEISQKISHMELIVKKIFQRAEQHPEVIPDIRKMMEYYLPTTIKLLEAYEELDAQPVQGENIRSSKKEIESTLDTLNLAFENLLDSIFKDTAWDVSTDISVLETMLAQEGLTKKDF